MSDEPRVVRMLALGGDVYRATDGANVVTVERGKNRWSVTYLRCRMTFGSTPEEAARRALDRLSELERDDLTLSATY